MKSTTKLCLGAFLCMLQIACSSNTDFHKEIAHLEQTVKSVPGNVVSQRDEEETQNEDSNVPLRLHLAQAIVMAMQNNPALLVSKIDPALQQTYEDTARAAFDPVLTGEISYTGTHSDSTTEGQDQDTALKHAHSGTITLQQTLPTGTTLELGMEGSMYNENGSENDADSRNAAYGMTITQPLLQGLGTNVNLVTLRQAQLDTHISQYELQAVSETLVSQVVTAYWQVILAQQSIDIYERSLAIAQEQAREIQERIRIGAVADTELAAAKALTASERENLINAQSDLDKAKLQFLRLLSQDGKNPWSRDIDLIDIPSPQAMPINTVAEHVTTGLNQRPDIRQALLEREKGQLEVIRTRNGLLPKLDLFLRLGNSTYANSFSSESDKDGNDTAWTVGLQLKYTLGKRAENAQHRHATLSVLQTQLALKNLKQLAQLDIRTAHVEIKRTLEQINASAATRQLRQEVLRTEEEKFRVGTSTALLVSQARRDLVSSQIAQVQAIIAYRIALLELHLADGTLLKQHRIGIQRQ